MRSSRSATQISQRPQSVPEKYARSSSAVCACSIASHGYARFLLRDQSAQARAASFARILRSVSPGASCMARVIAWTRAGQRFEESS